MDSHYVPSHLVEHPSQLQKWKGPNWWLIGNEVVDQYAQWGAQIAAAAMQDVAAQLIRGQITIGVQRRLVTIVMEATKAGPTEAVQRMPTHERRKELTAHQRGEFQGQNLQKLHPRWWCFHCRQGPEEGELVTAWLARGGQCGGAVGAGYDQNVALWFG